MQVRIAAAVPLKNRDFALFWAGQWVSQVGDYIFLVAQNWLIWQLTGSGAAMATVTLCSQVPAIGMLLVGGAMVDRWPRTPAGKRQFKLQGDHHLRGYDPATGEIRILP